MNTDCFFSARATAPIPEKTIVKYTANAHEAAPATGPSDPLMGVADLGAAAAGQMVDVAVDDVFMVRAGGALAPGDPLTSDASGRAVKAVKTAGAVVSVIGFARAPALEGDIIDYLAAPFVIAG